jgi:hypothetical protein
MKGRLAAKLLSLLFTALIGTAACQNGEPPAGAECTQGGAECVDPNAECGESLPYPCPGNQVCCVPPTTAHDAGGG